MSHYQERLEQDLGEIRREIRNVGSLVNAALKNAVHALLTSDKSLAYSVVLEDQRINRRTRKIDRLCHAFIVRHLPSAGHLRFISSVLRLDRELERIGDYAVTVARETAQLQAPIPQAVARDVDLLASQSRHVLDQSLEAFDSQNADLARGTTNMAAQVSQTFKKVLADLLREGELGTHPLEELFAWQAVLNSLERVADRAKNLCEETIFAVTGETKQPKVYRILFLDKRNDFRSQIAEAHARKAFPDFGVYSSAGWEPGESLKPEFIAFMEKLGLDVQGKAPKALDTTPEELAEYHIIVGLEEGFEEHLQPAPFHTVVLSWKASGDESGSVLTEEQMSLAFEEVATRLRELFETLRGEEAV